MTAKPFKKASLLTVTARRALQTERAIIMPRRKAVTMIGQHSHDALPFVQDAHGSLEDMAGILTCPTKLQNCQVHKAHMQRRKNHLCCQENTLPRLDFENAKPKSGKVCIKTLAKQPSASWMYTGRLNILPKRRKRWNQEC